MLALLLAGLAGPPHPPARDTAPSRTLEWHRRVDSLVRDYVATGEFSGTILLRRGGRTIVSSSYGQAERGLGVPNTAATRYSIGSIGKQFTAAAILVLEAQGKLGLGDPLSKYWPSFPSGGKITVRHLLDHTSGISRDLPDQDVTMLLPHSTAELVELIAKDSLVFEPGARRSYSNNAYRILAYIVETVSGQPFAAFLRTTFFEPLGMKNTGQWEELTTTPALARGYSPGFGSDGYGPAPYADISNGVGPGSLYSTPADMAIWAEAFLGRGAIHPEVRDKMVAGRFGILVDTLEGQRVIWHDGVYRGYTALLAWFPDLGTTIAYAGNTETIVSEGPIQDGLRAIVLGRPLPVTKPVPRYPPASGARAREYMGTYRFSPWLKVTVGLRDGMLVLDRMPVECPPTGDRCYYRLKGSGVEFTRDSLGKVTGMKWSDPSGVYPAPREP